MKRRSFIHLSSLTGLSVFNKVLPENNYKNQINNHQSHENDRIYWVNLLIKISTPVLENLANNTLRKNMVVDYSPSWDGRDKQVAYLEAFGRLLAGIAVWFNAPEVSEVEDKERVKIYNWALQSIKNAVNPQSPDYLLWHSNQVAQPLVDAAYFAHALIRCPKKLWEPLDNITKNRIIQELTKFRLQRPFNNNWVLFSSIIESFLLKYGPDCDFKRMDDGIDSVINWYVGDGWYSDGPKFAFDHYNGYDMHSMLIDCLKINVEKGRRTKEEYEISYKRMQRYAHFLERYISPEGYYLVIGRSSTYRTGAFQPLVQLALEKNLPKEISPAQVRSALTKVMKNIFIDSTFHKGWLRLGLVGDEQRELADYYSNTGSMYIASLVFLPLGLSPKDPFWNDPFTEWTQLKAWQGKPFANDYAVPY
ncbi:DUF2264 domain-containing protein [Rhizosphaericola mali]|uniref:DUF2264 domain-containing protein n=1 Tax=Rhizosphaericola mali TaxID=2545455 RepID=A0A5P2G1P0_9BACT|nr:DUF2264 domain-containing protein [Rhizosphaericola mali]QES89355.1 DUF2264 domain-containing protein [Rhizosphaericola mali]